MNSEFAQSFQYLKDFKTLSKEQPRNTLGGKLFWKEVSTSDATYNRLFDYMNKYYQRKGGDEMQREDFEKPIVVNALRLVEGISIFGSESLWNDPNLIKGIEKIQPSDDSTTEGLSDIAVMQALEPAYTIFPQLYKKIYGRSYPRQAEERGVMINLLQSGEVILRHGFENVLENTTARTGLTF